MSNKSSSDVFVKWMKQKNKKRRKARSLLGMLQKNIRKQMSASQKMRLNNKLKMQKQKHKFARQKQKETQKQQIKMVGRINQIFSILAVAIGTVMIVIESRMEGKRR